MKCPPHAVGPRLPLPGERASPRALAIYGGAPLFDEPLHVGRPGVGNREKLFERIGGALDRGWLTNEGPLVREFETRIQDLLGVRHCIATCNGTVALEIMARAAGLSGEVIVPSFTFVATAHALHWQGITPVFCDIDPKTHSLDPLRIEELITPRTTGILGVHTWGKPCDIAALEVISSRHGLDLFFDAAHAFGCSHGNRMIGNFGRAETFSFHATKFVNTFEGGAIVTNDTALAEKTRQMRNLGFVGMDDVHDVGINGKMSEISGAMGLTSLDAMDGVIERQRANYATYLRCLSQIAGLRMFGYDAAECNNWQYVVVEVDEPVTGLSRDMLVRVLLAENVRARRYFHPGCHRMEPYRSLFPQAGRGLPETEGLAERVLVLPTGVEVDDEAIRTVCSILGAAIADASGVRDHLDRLAG